MVPSAEADRHFFNNPLPDYHHLDPARIEVFNEHHLEQLQNTCLLLVVTRLELSSDLFHCSGLPHKPQFIHLLTEISLGGNDALEK